MDFHKPVVNFIHDGLLGHDLFKYRTGNKVKQNKIAKEHQGGGKQTAEITKALAFSEKQGPRGISTEINAF